MRFVDHAAGQPCDQRFIADLIAKPRHHGGDLRVKQRARRVAKELDEDFDILTRRVKHLHHGRVAQQRTERGEIKPLRQCVHHKHLAVGGELHHAELGPIGPLAHELGIDGDETLAPQLGASGCECVGCGDERRGGERCWLCWHGHRIHGAGAFRKRRD